MAFLKLYKQTIDSVLKRYFSFRNETKSLEPLANLLWAVKREDFEVFLEYLRNSPQVAENLKVYIHNVFEGRAFNVSLTEANILSENAFIPELKKRFLNSILPPVENEDTVWYLIDNVVVRGGKVYQYFRDVEDNQLDELFRILEIDRLIQKKSVKKELFLAMNILAWRVIGNAMEIDVLKMVPEYRNLDNPFIALQDELDILISDFKKDSDFVLTSKSENYKQIKIYLEQCKAFVNTAFKNSSLYGISSKVNQSLLKIRQQIYRIFEILNLLVIDNEEDYLLKSKTLFINILKYKSHRNDLKELADDSTKLLSHLITNHTAETGSHYITSTKKDYLKMFWKSSGGGVIVGALCILKLLYSYQDTSEFGHAFLYSFNYAMGFIMIYLMGFTLATKQPAMTAATMAKILSEEKNTRKNYVDFAKLVAQLFRSQFIAFVGNVLWAFPVALALIYGIDVLLNLNIATSKANKLLMDLDPFESKAIFHACIAGVFLFISGIIAGNVGNNSIYYQIPKRIAQNAFLVKLFGERFSNGLSSYYDKNWAGIVSNFWFGIFLGATYPIGQFLGLDLDIRHITFAAGNLALGLYGKDFSIDSYTIIISVVTVFLIGFFNFIVSFSLSMILAFRSREVHSGDVKGITKEIVSLFMKKPIIFFFPVERKKKEVKESEVH